MTADDYEYFAEVWGEETVDRPGGLWRRRGGDTEYLSLIDWAWHPAAGIDLPHPDLLVPIDHDQVRTLLGDHQRFAKYWVLREASESPEPEIRVYRQLPSPERLVEEVFGRGNTWIPTNAIRDFRTGGPHEVPDLEPIDPTTAERLIRETRDISGATEL
ncbi:hypothetical protein GCM10009789_66700 [Kribbella sancticallisti]|uniref:Uncharacterized protein n=1 Tax=Kribbella sancticallisti TaxID=460087 RepID=A0ABP4QCX0_9ACTN